MPGKQELVLRFARCRISTMTVSPDRDCSLTIPWDRRQSLLSAAGQMRISTGIEPACRPEALVLFLRRIRRERPFYLTEPLLLVYHRDQVDQFLLSIWQPIQSPLDRSWETLLAAMGSIC